MDDVSKTAPPTQAVQASASVDPTALASLGPAVEGVGGIDGLLAKLRAGGLGGAVDSWVAKGPNATVDPTQLEAALGPDTVQHLSAGSGLNVAQLLPLLAAYLPQIIDMLTPNGHVPSGGLNGTTAGAGTDLGALLGNVLGGSGSADIGGLLGGILGGDTKR